MSAKYFTFVNEKPSPILWCDLFEKRAYTPKPGQPGKPGEPKFSAQIILDVGSPDHNALKALFVGCARNDPQFASADLKALGMPWDLGDNINAEAANKGISRLMVRVKADKGPLRFAVLLSPAACPFFF